MAPVTPEMEKSLCKDALPLRPGEEGALEGTLEVRSAGVVGRWTPYHFVLARGRLVRYAIGPEGHPEELPEAVISASDLSKLELRDAQDDRRELCITVASPVESKAYRLRAELPEEAQSWLQALEAARVSARPRAAGQGAPRELVQSTPLDSPPKLTTASTATPRSQAVWSPLPSTRGGRSDDLAGPQAAAGSRRAWRPAGAARLDGIVQAEARGGVYSRASSPASPRSQASPSPRSRSVSPRTPRRLEEMHSLHHRKHQVFEEKRSCQEKEERSKWQQDYDSVMAKTKSPRNQSSLEEASARLYEDHVARRAGLEEMRRKVQHEHEQQIEATRFRRPASAANITPRGTTAPKGFVERTQEDAERRRKQREEADQQARPRSATRRARSISPAPGCTPRIAELYEDKARKARQEKLELAAKSELEQQHSFRPELKAKPGRAARPGLEARLEEMHREHAERLKRKKELAAKEEERRLEEAAALGTPSPRQTTPRRRATTPRAGLPDVVSLSMIMHGLDLSLLTDAFNRRLHGAISEAVMGAVLSEAPPAAAHAAARVSFAAAPQLGGGAAGRGRADPASALACQLQAEVMPPSGVTATAVAARLRASSCLGEALAAAVKAVPGLAAVGFRSEVAISDLRVATAPAQEPWREGGQVSSRQTQGGATSRSSRPSTPQGRGGARSASPAPGTTTRADHLVAAFAASVQRRCPLDPPLAPTALRGLVAPLNDAIEAFRQAARECQHSEGFAALCQVPSQRLLVDGTGRRRLLRPESWPSGAEPSPIWQAEDSLDELLATAAEAQHLLQEAVSPSRDDQPWLPGEVRQRPQKVPTALFAYASGPKARAAAETKALVLYGPAEGPRRYRHVLDLARLTLVFSTCDLLQAGLSVLMEKLEVVHVRNYFENPNQLGAKYIEVIVVVDVQKPSGHTVPHLCELRLEETCFWQAHQVAAPHLEQLVAQVHQLYGSSCRGMEDSVAYMARATLAATQTRHSLRFLRQRLSARFGSAVCGWRRALGAGGRLLAFGRLREACKTLKCQDQIMEYWSELDASYGGCISLFELDPEGTALLARLRERLLTSAGSADPAEMHRQLAVLGQAREGAPLSAAEFRAAARVLGFSATEAERLFAHLDTGGGGPSEEPGWVTAVDVAWLKRLPSLVDLGALALSPGEGAAGSPRGWRAAAGSRPQLVSGLFNLLDNAALSGAGALDALGLPGAGAVPPRRLGPAQLRRYACLCGFEGTDEEWSEEFKAICERYEWNASIGADARQFSQLVDDLEGGGYCPTDKLHDMLAGVALVDTTNSPCARIGSWHSYRYEHRSQQATGHREALTAALFHELDAQSAGLLGPQQVRRFAELCGFSGGDRRWAEEWKAMCHTFDWNPSQGLDLHRFTQLVDSDLVVYSDDDLQDLLSQQRLREAASGFSGRAAAGGPAAGAAGRQRCGVGSTGSNQQSCFDWSTGGGTH